MKKVLASVLTFLFISSLHAAIVSTKSITEQSIFQSPALLSETEGATPFYIDLKGYADSDMFAFLGNPAKAFSDAADILSEFLEGETDQYLSDNYDAIKTIFSFDPNFPSRGASAEEDGFFIRDYLENDFSLLDEGNRARAAINAASSPLGIYQDPEAALKGELDFSLRLGGGAVHNGFGWSAGMDIVYDGADTVISSSGESLVYLAVGGNVGYGTYISDKMAVGLSFSPSLRFRTGIANSDLLAARVSGNMLDLVMNNRFDFGMGLALNAGFMLKASDCVRIMMDLRNIPAVESYWYFTVSDVMSGFKFTKDEAIYLTYPDFALSVLWEKDKWQIWAEVSNLVDSLIIDAAESSASFDILSVPKFYVSYDIFDDLSVMAEYRCRTISLGVAWNGLKASVSSRIDKLGCGFAISYVL